MDIVKTVEEQHVEIIKEKGSKFIACLLPFDSIKNLNVILISLEKEYPKATHYCYAYRLLDNDKIIDRANDNGEPSGTAGKPILNQLISNQLANCILVVIRYFGGTKLGASGLINAYKSSAKFVIDNAAIIEKDIYVTLEYNLNYSQLNIVMQLTKKFLAKSTITSSENDLQKVAIAIPQKYKNEFLLKMNEILIS